MNTLKEHFSHHNSTETYLYRLELASSGWIDIKIDFVLNKFISKSIAIYY